MLLSRRGFVCLFSPDSKKRLCKINRVEIPAKRLHTYDTGESYLDDKIYPLSIAVQTWVDMLAELLGITRAAQN